MAEDDVKLLFNEFGIGGIEECSILKDDSGKSKGISTYKVIRPV